MDNLVRVWPSIGIGFAKEHGGAFRVWTCARHLDAKGSGWAWRAELKEFLKGHRVGKRNIQRWIQEAIELGLLIPSEDRKRFSYASLLTAARCVDLREVGNSVEVEASDLLDRSWKAHIFGAYLSAHEGKLVSRTFLEAQTGIPERTQRDYCRVAGVRVRENYHIEKPERGIMAETGVFGWRDLGNKRNPFMLARRLPNIYLSPFARGRKGRARKVNRELKSCIEPRLKVERLYYADPSASQVASLIEQGRVAYKLRASGRVSNQWSFAGE